MAEFLLVKPLRDKKSFFSILIIIFAHFIFKKRNCFIIVRHETIKLNSLGSIVLSLVKDELEQIDPNFTPFNIFEAENAFVTPLAS